MLEVNSRIIMAKNDENRLSKFELLIAHVDIE